jgi:aspartyl protease family protein
MATSRDKQGTSGLGQGMTIAAWIIAILLLAFLFQDHLDNQRNPNARLDSLRTDTGKIEVRLQRNRYGHYVATGEINGTPVELLLDTGATDVSIPSDLADRLGLERGPAQRYHTANGYITAYQTVIDEITLGDIRIRDVRASINPRIPGDSVLLGMSFLKHLDFSQQGDVLILHQ